MKKDDIIKHNFLGWGIVDNKDKLCFDIRYTWIFDSTLNHATQKIYFTEYYSCCNRNRLKYSYYKLLEQIESFNSTPTDLKVLYIFIGILITLVANMFIGFI